MRRLTVLFVLLIPLFTAAQPKQGQARLDSLLAEVPKMKEDTNGVKLMNDISAMYIRINPDEGLKWVAKALALTQKIGWRKGEGSAYNNFGNNYSRKGAYPDALEAFFKSLRIAEQQKNKERVSATSNNIGIVYLSQKDYPKALEYYFKALKVAEEQGDKKLMQNALGNIGIVYYKQGKQSEALEYENKALRMAEDLNDKRLIISGAGNIGVTYASVKQYPAALAYEFKALRIAEETGDKYGIANNLGNIGWAYYGIAADSAAPKPDSLVPASRAGSLAKAVDYLNKGIAASREAQHLAALSKFHDYLSQALALQGDYKGALAAYKQATEVKDSLFNEENTKKLTRTEERYRYAKQADSVRLENEKKELALQKEMQLSALRFDYEKKQAAARNAEERRRLQYEEDLKRQQISYAYEQKSAALEAENRRRAGLAQAEIEKRSALAAAELRRERTKRNAGYIVAVVLGLTALGAGFAFAQKRKDNLTIAREKKRSDDLLLNILPAEVAEELKESGTAHARQYEDVSVLFTDFVDFTGTAEKLSPQQIVKELHECFSAFDTIIDRNGLEKIKTVGDAYIAVCGLPLSDPRHAQKCVQAALEIRDFIEARRKQERVFEIRIGINSGPVVAGIVGVKKFAYDIWGDTVNTAARMEQHGEAGRINISGATYELVKDDFACTSRGKIAAKHKGEIEMYFVEALSTAKASITPQQLSFIA